MRFDCPRVAARRKRAYLVKENLFVNHQEVADAREARAALGRRFRFDGSPGLNSVGFAGQATTSAANDCVWLRNGQVVSGVIGSVSDEKPVYTSYTSNFLPVVEVQFVFEHEDIRTTWIYTLRLISCIDFI